MLSGRSARLPSAGRHTTLAPYLARDSRRSWRSPHAEPRPGTAGSPSRPGTSSPKAPARLQGSHRRRAQRPTPHWTMLCCSSQAQLGSLASEKGRLPDHRHLCGHHVTRQLMHSLHHMLNHILRQQMAPACQVSSSRNARYIWIQHDGHPLQTPSQWCLIASELPPTVVKRRLATIASRMRALRGLKACISAGRAEGAYHRVRHVLVGDVPLGVGVAQREEAVGVLQTA